MVEQAASCQVFTEVLHAGERAATDNPCNLFLFMQTTHDAHAEAATARAVNHFPQGGIWFSPAGALAEATLISFISMPSASGNLACAILMTIPEAPFRCKFHDVIAIHTAPSAHTGSGKQQGSAKHTDKMVGWQTRLQQHCLTQQGRRREQGGVAGRRSRPNSLEQRYGVSLTCAGNSLVRSPRGTGTLGLVSLRKIMKRITSRTSFSSSCSKAVPNVELRNWLA